MNAFTLRKSIRRAPPSLGGYWYHEEIGTVVYLVAVSNGKATVSTIQDPKERIGEDLFTVRLADLDPAESATLATA